MYVIGIDIGTQSLKAIVADGSLRVLGQASSSYEANYPSPGWAEQDALEWERALPVAIAEALKRASARPEQITAIAVAGQLDGCVAVGQDGLPLSPCLIWMDRRATKQAARVGIEDLRSRAGILADASHMAAKIAWLAESGVSNARCYHQPVSYLVSRLTGRHVYDPALASTTMLYSLNERDYDEGLLRAFGVSRASMPEIADAASVAGRLTEQGAKLTGLPVGIKVAVGTGDDFSATLGAGVAKPGQLIGILGTAEVVGALARDAVIDERGLVETHRFINGAYFVENPGWLAGGALTWFQSTFGVKSAEALDELASQAPAGSDGLLFLPALSGAMAPEWVASARGCFYGLTPAHGLHHMARAVLEGCAFAMRDVLDRLRELEVPIGQILLTGGGARSALWARIRADVCSLPVLITENKDTSAVGAVILAAVAGGLQPDVDTAARLVGQTSARFEPSPLPAYETAYRRYRLLFESLKPLYASQE